MFLSEVLEQLKYGELFPLGVKNLDLEKNKDRVVSAINLGLTDLHKRFWLREGNLCLQLTSGIYKYIISSEYCVSTQKYENSTAYILDDTSNPYEGDLLKIERIFNPEGEYQPLNDENAEYSFFTPRYNQIVVPVEYEDTTLHLEYRANHPKITSECPEDSTLVDISFGVLQALLLFVGSRMMVSMSPDQAQESMNMLQLYEAECMKIKALSYEIVPDRTNCKLDNRGWV